MCNGRGEADLGEQGRDHEGSRVEHGASAERAPLTLGCRRRRSLSKEDADLPGPPASGAAEDQAANWRERSEDTGTCTFYRYETSQVKSSQVLQALNVTVYAN
jgi:hypothetical protein